MAARNANIDAMRLVAALGVIALHSGTYPELPGDLGGILTGLFRWCVPFFYVVTGYYLTPEGARFPTVTLTRLLRPASVFAVAWLLYLPLLIARSGVAALGPRTLIEGTHFHLWYLSGLVVSLLVLEGLRGLGSRRLAIGVAALIVVACFAASLNYTLTATGYDLIVLTREFIGVPCILAGAAYRRFAARPAARHRAILRAGLLLLVVEIVALNLFGKSYRDMQWGLSTPVIALGLFGTALTAKRTAPEWMARLGREESLGIYVWHPAFMIPAAALLGGAWIHPPGTLESLPLWALTAVLTLLGLRLLGRAPRLRALADGDLRALSRESEPDGDGTGSSGQS
ncbi:acyltransferase family protein [Salipiger sp.]|uniref:acyltransferase family protein n=1 Tax=Salipiger sp. TaxID=2078585 RepID=UPI003A98769B